MRNPTEMESAYAAQILKMVEEASPGFLDRLVASVRKFAAAFERLPAETQARMLALAEQGPHPIRKALEAYDDAHLVGDVPEEEDHFGGRSLGMVCSRCNQHTGNNNQGHYWGLCKVLMARGVPFREAVREMHFCCPGDCELEAERDA